MSNSNTDGFFGYRGPEAGTSEYNALLYTVTEILSGRNYCIPVKVVNFAGPGGASLAGTVDVQPMVNMLDGEGNSVPHGIVNGLPYMRWQGGGNAVILDPQVGDIGLALFADRDISSVKATREIANPGSARQADYADGIYLGGIINNAPTQYVQFLASGIVLHSPQAITLEAPTITLSAAQVNINATTATTITTPTFTVNGATQLNGGLTATGNITSAQTVTGSADVIGAGTSLHTHKHGGKPPTLPGETTTAPV